MTEADFITKQHSPCLHVFHELWELGDSEYQYIDDFFKDFFTENNHTEPPAGDLVAAPLPVIQLPDSVAIIE